MRTVPPVKFAPLCKRINHNQKGHPFRSDNHKSKGDWSSLGVSGSVVCKTLTLLDQQQFVKDKCLVVQSLFWVAVGEEEVDSFLLHPDICTSLPETLGNFSCVLSHLGLCRFLGGGIRCDCIRVDLVPPKRITIT